MTSATLDRPARPAAVRLTRRGRVVLLLTVLALGLTALVVGAASVAASTSSAPGAPSQVVVVQPGQTLWELAGRVAPERDPRDVIRLITEANGLAGPVVAPGQSLVIPAL